MNTCLRRAGSLRCASNQFLLRQRPQRLTIELVDHPPAVLSGRGTGSAFVAVLSLRYYDQLSARAPHSLVLATFILFFIVLLLPVPIALGMPLLSRARHGSREVDLLHVSEGNVTSCPIRCPMAEQSPSVGFPESRRRLICRDFAKPARGLEPRTPSLQMKCSTN